MTLNLFYKTEIDKDPEGNPPCEPFGFWSGLPWAIRDSPLIGS